MKKRILSTIMIFMTLLMIGCGTKEQESIENSMFILPKRIESIGEGGIIPEGSEASVDCVSEYSLEMLWGTWIIDPFQNEDVASKSSFLLRDGDTTRSFDYFPVTMTFNPAWAGLSNGKGYLSPKYVAESNLECEKRNTSMFLGQISDYQNDISKADEPLGYAIENLGYGAGTVELNIVKNESTEEVFSITPIGGYCRKVIYGFHENILAIGLTEDALYRETELEATDITEIDFEVHLEGNKLTLTHNDQSRVYIPEQLAEESGNGIEILQAGVTDNYDSIDHILGITILPEGESRYDDNTNQYYCEDRIMFNLHEGFVAVDCEFSEDGTLKIYSSKGDSYEYKYFYSGDSLTLKSEKQTAVYSIYNYILEAGNDKPVYSFQLNGENLGITTKKTLYDFIEMGFQTNINLSQPIASCQTTEEIILTYQGAKLAVKVGNPFKDTIKIGDARVCYYRLDDTTGIITKGDGSQIGITTYDEVEMKYAPYEKKENRLRYIGSNSGLIMIDSALGSSWALEMPQDMDVIYNFENGVLVNIIIEEPILLYNGLQNNVDNSLLAQMEPAEFAGVIEVRDAILDRLRFAFVEAGISVDINEATGEVVMDNDVLFSVDEYELSQVGKQYIDGFMGVYASVITAETFSDYISEVRFEGHTDSSGAYGYNLILSQNRADSVLEHCLESTNNGLSLIQRDKLKQLSSAIGYSSSDLVYDEYGNEDMEASRRVSVKFFINVENAKNVSTNIETTELEVGVEEEQYSSEASLNTEDTNTDAFMQLMDNSSIILMENTAQLPFLWSLPSDLEAFSNDGWSPIYGLGELIDPGYWAKSLIKNNSSFDVVLYNEGTDAIPARECEVIAVIVDNTMNTYVEIKGEIDLNSTVEEINSVYGASSNVHEESGYTFITYTEEQSIHFVKGNNYSGILFTAPGFTYGTENIFYETFNYE